MTIFSDWAFIIYSQGVANTEASSDVFTCQCCRRINILLSIATLQEAQMDHELLKHYPAQQYDWRTAISTAMTPHQKERRSD